VPYDGSLDLLDRNLHLAIARSDPGRRMLGQPADDLRRGAILGSVVRHRDLWVQCRGDRPGLGSVDGDLNEPNRLGVGT